MQADYNQNEELAMRIRKKPTLAFASPSDVAYLFAAVVQDLPMPQETEVVLCFERTYIGRLLQGGTCQAPLFPIYMWNFNIDTPFGLPSTTNAVEGWYGSFKATVGCHCSSIWKFITALKREQELMELRQAKFTAGAATTKWRHAQEMSRR